MSGEGLAHDRGPALLLRRQSGDRVSAPALPLGRQAPLQQPHQRRFRARPPQLERGQREVEIGIDQHTPLERGIHARIVDAFELVDDVLANVR